MNVLKETYVKNTYQYELVCRNTHAAMYRQMDGLRIVGYEVGYVKSDKGGTIGDRVIEAGERFWSNEDFGSIAWSISDPAKAFELYESLKPKA